MSSLSPDARLEYYTEIAKALPPTAAERPDLRDRRAKTALDAFDALHPGDAFEARLAVQIVLSGAHAAECLRLAGRVDDEFRKMMQCRAQAASLMREMRAAMRHLAKEQKARLAAEEVAGSAPAQPVASAEPQPGKFPLPPPPVPAAAPRPAPVPQPVQPPRLPAAQAASQAMAGKDGSTHSPEAIAQAEDFARKNIFAAVRLRQEGGVTPQNEAAFRNVPLPEPAVLDALIHGLSPLLCMMDESDDEALSEAA